jgi:hypothetical protein
MTAAEFVAAYRRASPAGRAALDQQLAVAPEPKTLAGAGSSGDAHQDFRTELTQALDPDCGLADRPLIRALFEAEWEAGEAFRGGENLAELSYHLVLLGQLEDCFLLYRAKYTTGNMDTGIGLDRQIIAVGHEVAAVIDYVTAELARQPALAREYPGLLPKLQELQASSDFERPAEYRAYLRAYLADGAEEAAPRPNPNSGYQPRPRPARPWWKFW